MKILIISQYHPPEMGAAAMRWYDYARILTKHGHDVTVLSELPNYPSGIINEKYSKKWFWIEKDSTEKFTIVRTAVWANPRKTTIQRIGFYLSFMYSAIYGGLKLGSFDLIIASSPPLFVGISGMILSKIKRIPMVFDIRDLWPESARALGEINSSTIFSIAKWFEAKIYSHSTGFFLAVPGFSNYLTEKFPFTKHKIIESLMNGVSQDFLNEVDNVNVDENKQFTVLYSGNIGLAQGLGTILKAAQILKNYPIKFQIVGDGVERASLEKMKQKLGISNVEFVEPISRKKLISFIKSSSVCLVPLKNNPLFKNAVPSKLLEYMVCGKPVIVAVKGEVEDLMNKSNSGMCVEPEDEQKLADGVLTYYNDEQLRKKHGNNGSDYIRKNFMKEKLIVKALKNVEKILC
jgi:glycosyltransferase involved in cell wall biosynthesis